MRILGSTTFGKEPRQERDYYATDPEALRKFLDAFNADGEKLSEDIWECAAGEGNLSKLLRSRGKTVRESDIYDYGLNMIQDFLEYNESWNGDIVTNPPYKIAKKFIEHGISLVEEGNKIIMLLRIQFLESKGRHEFFKQTPPKFVYVHSSRIKIWKNNDKIKYPGTQPLCYAWYVWEKGFEGNTTLRWIK
jgi:hypothetical protein